MNKQAFLKELRRKLKNLKKGERNKYIEYYDEMISDIMETGVSEKEAVKRQGNVEQIVSDILAESGLEKVKVRDWYGICLIAVTVILMVNCVIQLSFQMVTGGNGNTSITIIGGADGPTSIFLAGKIGTPWGLYIITGVVVIITIFYFVKKHKKY